MTKSDYDTHSYDDITIFITCFETWLERLFTIQKEAKLQQKDTLFFWLLYKDLRRHVFHVNEVLDDEPRTFLELMGEDYCSQFNDSELALAEHCFAFVVMSGQMSELRLIGTKDGQALYSL